MCFRKEKTARIESVFARKHLRDRQKGNSAETAGKQEEWGSSQLSKGGHMNDSAEDRRASGLSRSHTAMRGAKCIGNGLLESRGPTGLL